MLIQVRAVLRGSARAVRRWFLFFKMRSPFTFFVKKRSNLKGFTIRNRADGDICVEAESGDFDNHNVTGFRRAVDLIKTLKRGIK
jgi:hypothetical protein